MNSILYYLIIDPIQSPVSFVAGLIVMNSSYLIKQNKMTMLVFTEMGLEAVTKSNSKIKNREVVSTCTSVRGNSQCKF
ncbi:MAG: hypothetical protein NVV82_19705 [Sporocytophaga sp.]|nr:hypothetical protein [Sporocytophaga sp.]